MTWERGMTEAKQMLLEAKQRRMELQRKEEEEQKAAQEAQRKAQEEETRVKRRARLSSTSDDYGYDYDTFGGAMRRRARPEYVVLLFGAATILAGSSVASSRCSFTTTVHVTRRSCPSWVAAKLHKCRHSRREFRMGLGWG